VWNVNNNIPKIKNSLIGCKVILCDMLFKNNRQEIAWRRFSIERKRDNGFLAKNFTILSFKNRFLGTELSLLSA